MKAAFLTLFLLNLVGWLLVGVLLSRLSKCSQKLKRVREIARRYRDASKNLDLD